jgi:hypothetical protein
MISPAPKLSERDPTGNMPPAMRIVLARQAKTRPRPLACEAIHRIKDDGSGRKRERAPNGSPESIQTLDIP